MNWTWKQVKERLRLIYPSDESRNYHKGMDRLLFQFEGQLHPLNIDKLRKAMNSIVRLYLEHSDGRECRLVNCEFRTTIGFKANPMGFSTVRKSTELSAKLSKQKDIKYRR